MQVKTCPWYQYYPASVPQCIQPVPYHSLVEWFEVCVRKYAALPAYECMGTTLSFTSLDQKSRNFAAFLQQDLGLEKGTRIAIQLPNILQYPIALFGALRAGLVIVNTNPLYTAREMKQQFSDSGAEAIVILANFASNLEEILPDTAIRHIIITEAGDQLNGWHKHVVNGVVRHIQKKIPAYNLPGSISFNRALKKGRTLHLRHDNLTSGDTAFLQYTGGTTGVSKAAILSHRNILANMEQLSSWLSVLLKEGEETVVTPLPLYHIYALSINCFTMMNLGARNVLVPNAKDTKAFINVLRNKPFTVLTGINTLYNNLLEHEDLNKVDFTHLKLASSGGMSMQKSVALRWEIKTGIPIAEGYGLTETSPVLTCNIPQPKKVRMGWIGFPMPGTDIIIADEKGRQVPYGMPGEILAKGPQIMKGYWNRPDETALVFNEQGWFKTGDIGVMDHKGCLKIVDRKKEMILVSGFNVYPNEIENVIAAHEKVLEVGAIGVPDDHSGEAVKICVVRKDDTLSKEELLAYCHKNLTAYKIPKHIEFKSELPKTNVGKVLRRALRTESLRAPVA